MGTERRGGWSLNREARQSSMAKVVLGQMLIVQIWSDGVKEDLPNWQHEQLWYAETGAAGHRGKYREQNCNGAKLLAGMHWRPNGYFMMIEIPMAISWWLKFHWPHSQCNLAKKCNCSHVVTFILKWVISKIVWFTNGFDRGEVRWSYYFLRPGRGETKAHFVHLKHWKFQPGFCNSHKLNKKTKHMNVPCSFSQCRKEE